MSTVPWKMPALLTGSALFALNACDDGRHKHRVVLAQELFGIQLWPVSASAWAGVSEEGDDVAAKHFLHCPFSSELLRSLSDREIRRLAGNTMNLHALGAMVAFTLACLC